MKGRKPKPYAMKVLSGNPSRRALKQPPKGLEGRISCPGWLDAEAKKQWSVVTKHLREMGLLASSDVGLIASYSQTMSRLKAAQEHITKYGLTISTGAGGFKKNPAVAILEKSGDMLRQLATELGLSPVARERLSIQTPNPRDSKKERFFDKYPA